LRGSSFPRRADNTNRPIITMVIMGPDQSLQSDPTIRQTIDGIQGNMQSARIYKSALIWTVPDSTAQLRQEARKLIAWQDIADEGLHLDDAQKRQLNVSLEKAKRDLKEAVMAYVQEHNGWLGKDGTLRTLTSVCQPPALPNL